MRRKQSFLPPPNVLISLSFLDDNWFSMAMEFLLNFFFPLSTLNTLFHCCLAFIFANDKLFCKESVFSLWLTLRLSFSGVLWFLSDVPTCVFAFIYLAEVLVCFFQEDSCLILENFHSLSFHICLYLSLELGYLGIYVFKFSPYFA